MTGLVERVQNRVSGFVRRWSNEAPARRFMTFARKRWPQPEATKESGVVLVGLFPSNPLIFCYGYVTNQLAKKDGSRIESYQFLGRTAPSLRDLYESFGARLRLTMAQSEAQEEMIEAQATEILRGVKTKWDAMKITVDGLLIGDQIYDSYLRFHMEPTVRIDDPRLRVLVIQALRILYAARDYLARNRVTAFITDDFSYINSGIITRLMFLAKVPIYMVYFGDPFWVLHADPNPSGAGHNYPPPACIPYYAYPRLFAELSQEKKSSALLKAREMIEQRLSGKFCPHVRMPAATYAAAEGRVLADGPEPRILIMLHDFVDSPHGYRDMLFPDFYEWLNFLLERATRTPFKWYVKPHPCLTDATRTAINVANERVIADFAARFPAITFLPKMVSNQQILNDGVSAMFTVHGTSAHEYAYCGIPVVNCGDNPHIAYHFNIHARNLEEYEACILNADRLEVQIEQREIEEFIYMHYFYLTERLGSPVNPITEDIFARPDWLARLSQAAIFDELVAGVTPERDRGVTEYLDRILTEPDMQPTPQKL